MKFLSLVTVKGKNPELKIMAAKADNFITRAVGLLATRELAQNNGLHILPCKDVHTWFMRFSIDVVFLSKDCQVLAIRDCVKPFRFVLGPKGTCSVLELASGAAALAGIEKGDVLSI